VVLEPDGRRALRWAGPCVSSAPFGQHDAFVLVDDSEAVVVAKPVERLRSVRHDVWEMSPGQEGDAR
jgi:hypothetical protein